MARIVGGSILGEIRGKLGGMVFAANRAGQYIRSYRVPVNPRTLAQSRARARFGAASGTYHSLTALLKANWQNFASSVFSPKIGINTGQFSGFNAYTSLRTVVENGNDINQSVDALVNGAAPLVAATEANFSFNSVPPVFMLQPAVKEQVTGNALALALSGATVGADGSFTVEMTVGGAPTGGYDIEDFIDPQDRSFGFVVQMSNANPQDGMFFQNPYHFTLGYIKPQSLGAPDRAAVETLGFESTSNIAPSNYQAFPIENDYVQVSLFSAADTGMLVCLGAFKVKVAATA